MSETSSQRRVFPLVPIVLLVWAVVYLLMMHAQGWQWQRPGATDTLQVLFGFGYVPDGVLREHGAAAPVHVNGGDWQRLFTGGLLHASLLNLLLVGWWWTSLAKGVRAITGTGAVLLAMLVGGVVGGLVHANVHPDSWTVGPGPFGWVTALIGLQMGLGFFGGLPNGKQLVWSSVFSLIVVGVLMWFFARGVPLDDPRLGLYGLGGSFGTGIVLPLLLGARRFARRAQPLVKPLAMVAGLACVAAIVVQVPQTVRAGDADELRSFLRTLDEAERKTRRVYLEAHKPWRRYQRGALEALDDLQTHRYREKLSSPASLQAYIDAMRKIANLDMVDPHARIVACRRALKRWYDETEKDLRRDHGLRPREPSQLRRWDNA